jgi:hypothetical protein
MSTSSRALSSILFLAIAATPALAQEAETQGAPVNADAVGDTAASDVEASQVGVRLTDGLYLHPYATLATAYQSNVFFEDGGDVIDSPLLRIGVGTGIETENAQRRAAENVDTGAATQKVAFKGDFNLTWNQYLSSNDTVSEQSDLGRTRSPTPGSTPRARSCSTSATAISAR